MTLTPYARETLKVLEHPCAVIVIDGTRFRVRGRYVEGRCMRTLYTQRCLDRVGDGRSWVLSAYGRMLLDAHRGQRWMRKR